MTDKDAVLATNAAYYQAFAGADFAKMSGIWAADEVSCIHPGWPVLIGRRAVLESYFNILANPSQEPIEHHSDTVMMSGFEARVFCIEIVGGVQLAATNWFRRVDEAWRMIHHQASLIGPIAADPAPPQGARLLN
jgi:SnoaL-like domain